MSHRKLGLLALIAAAAVIWLLPAASVGNGADGLKDATDRLRDTTAALGGTVQATLDRTAAEVDRAAKRAPQSAGAPAQTRQTSPEPTTDPPLHGTNPHGQGSVAVLDVNPSAERPQGGATDGSDSDEEVVIGRARGEEQADGSFRGKITVAALFGNDIVAVETQEGQSRQGPLEPVQQGILDPLCDGSGNQLCLSAVTADSDTNANGSSNRFSTARGQVGGADGLSFGAAESQGNISEDGQCQTATGSSSVASANAGGSAVADIASASSTSRSCNDGTQTVENQSRVINLFGTAVPLPAPGCGEGTPDTNATGPLSPLVTIICNADTVVGAAGVRDALDVFVLNAGGTSVLKTSVAQSESLSQAPGGGAPPAPQCSDGIDNDGDGAIDFPADTGCTSAQDDSEAGGAGSGDTDPGGGAGGSGDRDRPECSDGRDNDGDGVADTNDPGCHTDGNPNNASSFDPDDDSEADGGRGSGRPECSDGIDNDGDGEIDFPDDPSCTSAQDDSESDAGALRSGSLPFSGTDVVGLALAGLLLLAGGLVLRRREHLLPRG